MLRASELVVAPKSAHTLLRWDVVIVFDAAGVAVSAAVTVNTSKTARRERRTMMLVANGSASCVVRLMGEYWKRTAGYRGDGPFIVSPAGARGDQ